MSSQTTGNLFGVTNKGAIHQHQSKSTGAATLVRSGHQLVSIFEGCRWDRSTSPIRPGGSGGVCQHVFSRHQQGVLYALTPRERNWPCSTRRQTTAARQPYATGINNPTGLAFSPLDYNLWHPTNYLGDADVAGHGISTAPDNTRRCGPRARRALLRPGVA